jgi:hypothetical protein
MLVQPLCDAATFALMVQFATVRNGWRRVN